MRNPERKDRFYLPDLPRPQFGYLILRKSKAATNDGFLPELEVLPNAEAELGGDTDSEWRVIDEDLYNSIEDGDIGLLNRNGWIRIILSKRANHNTILVTEQCDSKCRFCSQPPKDLDDSNLLAQAGLAISAFQYEGVVGISGGEPLLYGEKLLDFLKVCTSNSPQTSYHILTNGRALKDFAFAQKLAKTAKENTTLGIPLHATSEHLHDYLAGASGAFRETVQGLLHASGLGIPVELRIIPTQGNYRSIPEIIEFAGRILSNISQISVMNLEPMGWAKQNWKDLYLSPLEYSSHLEQAIKTSQHCDIPVSLFNYPLCHLPMSLWPHSVRSISDWKNFYPEECEGCDEIGNCCGFFTSSQRSFFDQPRRII